eukprot:335875-Amphidinium_carterae.4
MHVTVPQLLAHRLNVRDSAGAASSGRLIARGGTHRQTDPAGRAGRCESGVNFHDTGWRAWSVWGNHDGRKPIRGEADHSLRARLFLEVFGLLSYMKGSKTSSLGSSLIHVHCWTVARVGVSELVLGHNRH